MITIFRNVLDTKEPKYIRIDTALERIKTGRSKAQVELIRAELDADKRNLLKQQLPCVLFSGQFKGRTDDSLQIHSGYVILDFDHVKDVEALKTGVFNEPFCLAAWKSPSGDGVKALVKIKFPGKHREHYAALLKHFKEKRISTDEKNSNPSRVAYESYDPDIFIKTEAVPYDKLEEKKTYQPQVTKNANPTILYDTEKWNKLVKWMSNSGELFVEGNRNNFLFKLCAA